MSDYDFRYENSINYTKEYLETEGPVEHKYASWRTNTVLSNFADTIMQANAVNILPDLDDKLQYDFLFYSIKPKKRFFKKQKGSKNPNFEIVQDFYKYNGQRTKEALRVLTKEQLDKLKKQQEKGGLK